MTIIETLVTEHQRLSIPAKYFKQFFPLNIEPAIYHFASQLSKDYLGGYWHFYTLSNGGFYMVPDSEKPFSYVAENGHLGLVSADGFGIIVCLYAYSHISFSDNSTLMLISACHYQSLRAFAFNHPEARGIFRD